MRPHHSARHRLRDLLGSGLPGAAEQVHSPSPLASPVPPGGYCYRGWAVRPAMSLVMPCAMAVGRTDP
ncbi:hypothetical protein I6A84_20345 [Frankia sp. CNm7]|uniref:Uncharacterized protein n=1 Tax=Frankia nepalensis TaxID=1836974 RepID=A0A937US99_9ACTN|nr:hypothetical protein [Frankia nepalensis]MBL7497277.1 hypothetical protein [Frankia nepalensis]MBL7512148.1 hypothetical protein [Frankia nepalensis]MBL7520373.1 hypothetical protein [Frankia nepalensis]MBL7631918.1 hypothetical protein [Frankia nepalensis]